MAEQQNEPAKRRRAAQTNEAQAAPEAPAETPEIKIEVVDGEDKAE